MLQSAGQSLASLARMIRQAGQIRLHPRKERCRHNGRVHPATGVALSKIGPVPLPVALLTRKPGALRNGAPFKDWMLPGALERIAEFLPWNLHDAPA